MALLVLSLLGGALAQQQVSYWAEKSAEEDRQGLHIVWLFAKTVTQTVASKLLFSSIFVRFEVYKGIFTESTPQVKLNIDFFFLAVV